MTVVAGVAALVLPSGGTPYLVWVLSAWAIVAGRARARQRHPSPPSDRGGAGLDPDRGAHPAARGRRAARAAGAGHLVHRSGRRPASADRRDRRRRHPGRVGDHRRRPARDRGRLAAARSAGIAAEHPRRDRSAPPRPHAPARTARNLGRPRDLRRRLRLRRHAGARSGPDLRGRRVRHRAGRARDAHARGRAERPGRRRQDRRRAQDDENPTRSARLTEASALRAPRHPARARRPAGRRVRGSSRESVRAGAPWRRRRCRARRRTRRAPRAPPGDRGSAP